MKLRIHYRDELDALIEEIKGLESVPDGVVERLEDFAPIIDAQEEVIHNISTLIIGTALNTDDSQGFDEVLNGAINASNVLENRLAELYTGRV